MKIDKKKVKEVKIIKIYNIKFIEIHKIKELRKNVLNWHQFRFLYILYTYFEVLKFKSKESVSNFNKRVSDCYLKITTK